jgi:hypothetical protein
MLFYCAKERPSYSPFVEKIWYTRSEQAGDFTSTATSHSGIVVTRYQGQITVTVRGPETKATAASIPADGEFWGIDFKLGTFMLTLLPKNLRDRRDVNLPFASNRSFWLDSVTWEIPTFDNADAFVARLVREGLLVHDAVVTAVLQGHPQAFSSRALQYRFLRATGLPYKVIQQTTRAHCAATLIQQGTPISDVAFDLGYFDRLI